MTTFIYGNLCSFTAITVEIDEIAILFNICDSKCQSVNFIMVLEAMVGILYAGFASAVLFAKLWATQGMANVSFSEAMVIRYGLGVESNELYDEFHESDDDIFELGKDDSNPSIDISHSSCDNQYPILEFRIVNNVDHGPPLLEAEVKCFVKVESQQDQDNRLIFFEKIGISNDEFGDNDVMTTKTKIQTYLASQREMKEPIPQAKDVLRSLGGNTSTDSILLGNDNKYRPLELQCSVVPIFKRVWILQHVLNEDSPLLRWKVKAAIKKEGGWPKSYNTTQRIRRLIRKFDELHVIFQAVSHSGIKAYKHKTYLAEDLVVGYRFADMSYLSMKKRQINIDRCLINDITEQNYGGGEALSYRNKKNE